MPRQNDFHALHTQSNDIDEHKDNVKRQIIWYYGSLEQPRVGQERRQCKRAGCYQIR